MAIPTSTVATSKLASFVLFALVGVHSSILSAANPIDELKMHPAIPLLDEQGGHVLDSGNPYSPKMSCGTGGCHDYDAITSAYHFETGRDEASDDFGKKMGILTQLVSPGYYGGYNCMGSNAPDQLAKKANSSIENFGDHGSAGYVKRCYSCHSGGGWMEKDRDGVRYDEKDVSNISYLDGDYFNRGTDEDNNDADSSAVHQWDWKKSGVVENDCFLCHADLDDLKTTNSELGEDSDALSLMRSMRGNLVGDNHFRYTTNSILEFLNLDMDGGSKTLLNFERGAATEGVVDADDLVLNDSGNPIINWNASAFNDDKKVEIPMLRYPHNDSCMLCHRTANSRRGFYGFGDTAQLEYEDDGVLVEDYKDDVHFGLTWKEDNGEEREIGSCNACHAKNYYKPSYSNVDLDANHDFPKGNSDMDVHNDLDYEKDDSGKAYVKSCLHCHEEANEPAIPSGHDSMRDAHRESWRVAGDMYGYPKESLNQITQKHLDVVTCEACHITDKAVRGTAISPMYRYAKSADDVLRIRPYKPKVRSYWKDNASGYVLSKNEINSVFELKTDKEGNKYGSIVDPLTNKEVGTVSARMSHGSYRFGEPDTYDTMKALKAAYDSLLTEKGLTDPNISMVVSEINHYVLSHGTKPAVKALQCEQCHEQKQNGAFSALISPNGVFGEEGNQIVVTELPDRRLVDEGIVVLDYPYMKLADDGTVTENVSDILYYSGINPSLSRLNLQAKSSSANASSSAVESDSGENTQSNGGGGGATYSLPILGLFLLVFNAITRRRQSGQDIA